jgi:hypothetical protein
MAIQFLNTVNFNKNQLFFPRIQNLGADPNTANSSIGQIYFNTAVDTLKQYVADDGSGNPGWTEIGSTTVKAGVGIGVTFVGGEAIVRNTGLVTVLDGTYIDLSKQGGGDNTQLTADLSAVDGTSVAGTRFLSKDNTWDVISDQIGIRKATSTALGTVKLFSDTVQTVAATAVSATAARTYGVQFNSSDQMVVNVPWTDTNVVTYTLDVPTGTTNINLKGSDGTDDPITLSGTTGRTAITRINDSELRVDLTDDVIIIDDLTVGGVITQTQTGELNTFSSKLDMGGTGSVTPNKIINLATGTAATDAVNLGQVELLVAGVGVFQGGYNATTDPGVPKISGSANVALDQGDYFVVSHDGDITFSGTTTTGVNSGALANSTALVLAAANTSVAVGMDVTGTGVPPGITIATVTNSTNFVLSSAITIANTTTLTFSDKVVSVEVGDFIFANAAITASSNPAASAYTIVQSDANIAGAGATDGATEKGVAGFDSANFAVSASGWVQLKPLANPYGAKVALASGDNTTAGQTTFTVDVTALFAGADARNCKVEVLLDAGGLTVYPEVTRNGSGDVLLEFMPQVGNNLYSALITIV